MEFIKAPLEGVVLIQPRVFEDERGYFYESYSKRLFEQNGILADFVQDNQSLSQKGVLRGLHFQNPPYAQGKLVRVIKGAVLDVALDIRKNSPTYGQHYAARLDEKNKSLLWVPEGFAHGFLTLEDNTIFHYKCTNVYNKESEGSVLWNDPALGIDWGVQDPVLSEKDRISPSFNSFVSSF